MRYLALLFSAFFSLVFDWSNSKHLNLKIEYLPPAHRPQKVRGKGGTTVIKDRGRPGRLVIDIEGVGRLWLDDADLDAIIELRQIVMQHEEKRRNTPTPTEDAAP